MAEINESKKKSVHSTVRCSDTLLQIGGRNFLEDAEVEVIDGPVTVKDGEGELTEVVKVRHLTDSGLFHEGWIPYSFVK
jgi:hypothetical protein